ncbi:cell division control protein 48 C-like isoform X2 [Salvia divinorum]|uniref:Cell division control protein 48 C-like isoform X2 n=1 Tax=Salvia divinorum TaxID=28513 RepID=A0ABD1G7Z5_SALDI
MAGESGSVSGTLYACDYQIMRCPVETTVDAGAKSLSDAQNVHLSVDKPTAKRQKNDESQDAARQIEVAKASPSATHSSSNGRDARSHKSGGDVDENDANVGNVVTIGELEQGKELGDSKREVKKTENKWPMFSDIGGLPTYMLQNLKEEHCILDGSLSNISGILELFSKAYKNAPSIVFIDEIDAMTSKAEFSLQCPLK